MSMPPETLLAAARPRIEACLGKESEITPLGWSASATYRVHAEGSHFLLRLHEPVSAPFEPGYSTRAAIESECAWLQALAVETLIEVPAPIPIESGQFVFDIRVAGRTVLASLLTWVPGEVIDERRTPAQTEDLAALLAALQEHGETWQKPDSFQRPTLDRRWVHESVARVAALAKEGLVDPAHLTVIRAALGQAEKEMAEHERGGPCTGLIHADLHGDNYVEHAGRLAPIDFGRAALGPWLLDVAECAMHLFPDRRADLFDAYAKLRPWPSGAERIVESYMVQAIIESFGYNAPNPDTRDGVLRSIPGVCDKHFARYLDGQPFAREV